MTALAPHDPEHSYERLLAAQAVRIAAVPDAPPMPAGLAQAPAEDGDPVVVDRTAATAVVTTWAPDAFERVVLGDRTVTLATPALPDPRGPDAAAQVRALIKAVTATLTPMGLRTQLTLRWPHRDTAMRRVLEDAGLQVDAIWTWHAGPRQPPRTVHAAEIRPARPADAQAVAELAVEEVRFHLPYSPFTRDLPVTRDWAEAIVGQPTPSQPVFVATVGETVAGYAVCSVVDTPDDGRLRRTPPGAHAHFLSVAVRADARGRGLGTALVSRVQAILAHHGVHRFSAAYVPGNPLSSVFWPARGFEPVWIYYAAIL